MALGYIHMAMYLFIILVFFLISVGGWCAGYWVFDKSKAQAYNDMINERDGRGKTVKLN